MSVLILGATSSIARAVAEQYAKLGHSLFIAARDAAEAERIASDIAIRFDTIAKSAAFDATAFDTHLDFVDSVESQLGELSVAVVAFGAMGDQGESEGDFAAAKRVIDINYTGAVSLCEALASRFEHRKRGALIGIASVAGDRGRASNYFYGSAKGAFALYLQGLRNRLHKANVTVTTVKLGFVDTRMTFGIETKLPIASPEATAQAIVNAQRRGADTLYYPQFWWGIMGIIKAIPERVFKKLSL